MRRALVVAILGLALGLTARAAAQPQPKHVTPADLARFRAERAGARPARAARRGGRARPGPKLVVLLVVDQLRAATLERLAPGFGKGGFQRLLRQGAVLHGHYGHQNTYTGPGHALIGTGSYGYLNGIVQNKWYNRAKHRSEAMIHDSGAHVLGAGAPGPGVETSPRNLLSTTFGDELRLATAGESRVVAVAIKERGSILTGGRTGQAYWLDAKTGQFTTSTYYMRALPAWLQAFNARRPFDAWFGKKWERLLPADAYLGEDDLPFEGSPGGLGRAFPHPLTGKLKAPGPKFYGAMTHTPMATDVTFDVARAAVEGEHLGARGVTDVLSISISTTDLVGHAYGDLSHEYQDTIYRADRSLAAFLAYLDRRFKAGDVVIALTADHGAVPVPELVARMGLDGARIKKAAIKKAVEQALGARFGQGKWVVALEDPSVYLNHRLMAEKRLDPALVERVAGEALLNIPGIIRYFTRTQILNGWLPPTEAARAVARSYFPPRAGDVIILTQPFVYWGKYGEKDVGSTHGTPYRYDTDVPLILVGAPFRAGRHGDAEMVDLAATLSRVLGVNPPAACEGRALERVLK